VEFRSESDPDVAPYCHSKEVQVIEVQVGAGIKAAQEKVFAAMRPIFQKLVDLQVL
jgi:ERCC4-related helicase